MAKYSLTDVIRRGKLDGGFKKVKRKFQCIDRNLFDKQFVYGKGDWIKKKSKMELTLIKQMRKFSAGILKLSRPYKFYLP